MSTAINRDDVADALATVQDPEIHRPLVELDMIDSIEIDGGTVRVTVLLTIAGCPMKDTLRRDVTAALAAVAGVEEVVVELAPMSDEQRAALKEKISGPSREIPFSLPTNTTRVLAIASGKGGVGKSTVTVNLALALAAKGHSVGILDADVYGHSVPGMLGIPDAKPTPVEGMIMPVPALGLKVISMGMFKERRSDIIAWRGPILDKALDQMLAEVYWGDLDYLLLDLPPGTGDIAMSLGKKLPGAEVLVVTTPQEAAADVAERAGVMAALMRQQVIGVVENMSSLRVTCPDSDKVFELKPFGEGGGQETANRIGAHVGAKVPLLAQIPMEIELREGGDVGSPIVLSNPDSQAAQAFGEIADAVGQHKRSIMGIPLGLNPQG